MNPEQKPLGQHLRAALSEAELSATWSQIEASRKKTAQRTARRRGAAATLAACAVVLAAVWIWPRASGELSRRDGLAFHRVDGRQSVQLADDSRIVTQAASSVEVLENSRSKLALHLISGAARFEVTPGTGRQWTVEAGGLSVEVTGTIFTVERGPARARVAVERGTVIVRGARVPDGVRRLTAGEELVLGATTATAPALPVEPPLAPVEAAPEEARPPEPALESPPPHAAPSPPAPLETAASELVEADRLRREGRVDEAVARLSSVTERWPRSAEAPLAALTAANLLQDSGDSEGARRWYRRALELGLSGPLAETAREALDAGPRR